MRLAANEAVKQAAAPGQPQESGVEAHAVSDDHSIQTAVAGHHGVHETGSRVIASYSSCKWPVAAELHCHFDEGWLL
jgi:hypothetical protein